MRWPKVSTRNIDLPKDEGFHPDADFEWWYFNGHAWSDDGNRYGLMVCFLNQVGGIHDVVCIMVFDVKTGKCLTSIVKKGKTRQSLRRLDLLHADNWWRHVQGRAFAYQMHVRHEGIGVTLDMESLKPPVIVGKLPLGLLGFVYYYALTRVGINGQLSLHDLDFRVTGAGWIDRMWGRCEWTALDGWEWFSIMLKSNVEVLVLRVLHPITRKVHNQILVITTPSAVVRTREFQVESFRSWTSPSRGLVYRLGWRIRATRPSIDLQVCPTCLNQELRRGIWEGECTVEGTIDGGRTDGYCYVELFRSYTVEVGLARRVLYLYLSLARFLLRKITPRSQTELLVRQIKALIPKALIPRQMVDY